jgi:protein-L-isoaspartate(D-aspartate) O-methyltransferase
MNLEQARFNMVEQQIRTWDVLDQRVLDAMMLVPRDAFAPPEYRALAYADVELPIGHGEAMMTPKLEARIVQSLRLTPSDRVLEIGTGSGFLTALLAHLGGHVYSMEVHADLSRVAATRLDALGLANVTLTVGDGSRGWLDHAPYDAIAVTGSLPALDDTLSLQLKVGGRLFVVVGEPPVMEGLLIARVSDREWSRESLFDTQLAPLRGLPSRQKFVF